MDPLDDFLEQQRRLAPAHSRTSAIERQVIQQLLPGPGRLRRVAPVFAIAAGCATIALAILAVRRDPPAPPRPPDFVESVVLVGDHTCIWLEPVKEAPHE